MEAFLQLGHLDACEGGARLFSLGRCAILVRMSDATSDGKGSCKRGERDEVVIGLCLAIFR